MGVGFPGWHIECSAMSSKYLGSFFDIHCGGEDHIPVHHTNEIAQTEACYGTRLANFWLHGHFLLVDERKESKSNHEFLRIQTLIDRGYDPLAYRYFCLGAHYRSKINFTWPNLDASTAAFNKLRTTVYGWGVPANTPDEGYIAQFSKYINDDLNMPRALASIWDLVKSDLPANVKKSTLHYLDKVMGLRLAEWHPDSISVPDNIMMLVRQREQARATKHWKDADLLREQVWMAGYEIDDTPHGSLVRFKLIEGQ